MFYGPSTCAVTPLVVVSPDAANLENPENATNLNDPDKPKLDFRGPSTSAFTPSVIAFPDAENL